MKKTYKINVEMDSDKLAQIFKRLSKGNLLETERRIDKLMRNKNFVKLLASDLFHCWYVDSLDNNESFDEIFAGFFKE